MIARLIKNIRNRGFKDILNPERWWMFLRSLRLNRRANLRTEMYVDAPAYTSPEEESRIREKFLVDSLKEEYSHIFDKEFALEQVAYRMSQEGCKTCLSDGQCAHCGCKTPDLFFEVSMSCSGGHWAGMMTEDIWSDYKTSVGIEIDPGYLDQIRKFGKIKEFH